MPAPPPGRAALPGEDCGAPGCTGIHTNTHGHPYATMCPEAKRKARARGARRRARLRAAPPPAGGHYRAGELARLGAAKTRPPAAPRCAYPGCRRAARDGLDLCSKYHSAPWPQSAPRDPLLIENEGIVDELAIDITVRNERDVALTWVERDIAIAMMLGRGLSFYRAALRAGLPVTSEDDPWLRGAKFRRLSALGRTHYGRTRAA